MKFSIVTPSYNQGAYLQRTIESVLQQREMGVELEYFILDNCSTDQTAAILAKYREHPDVTVIEAPDRGQADAINRGWALATGDVVAWLNADDVYWPGALRSVQQHFGQRPEMEALYGEALYINADDEVLKPVTNIRPYSRSRLKTHDFITQPATFLRRSVLDQTGPLSLQYRYVFDWDYWLRVSQRVDFVRVPEVLAGYRVTGHNLTTTGKGKRLREMLRLVWRYGGPIALMQFGLRLVVKRWRRIVEVPEVEVPEVEVPEVEVPEVEVPEVSA